MCRVAVPRVSSCVPDVSKARGEASVRRRRASELNQIHRCERKEGSKKRRRSPIRLSLGETPGWVCRLARHFGNGGGLVGPQLLAVLFVIAPDVANEGALIPIRRPLF